MRPIALPSLLLLATALAGVEVPSGVLALAAADPAAEPGASAVVVADGLAVTLAEALPAEAATVAVVLPPGRRAQARIERRGELALLRLDTAGCVPLLPAARAAAVGDEVWTAGNAVGAIEIDGAPALSRGTVSGRYRLPEGGPPVRGRGGKVVSALGGEVVETDAAVNDGAQGGALLDREGRLVGLVCLAQARERRLGTALPIERIAAAAGLAPPAAAPAASASDPVALVRLERPQGLGNPAAVPRPPRPVDEAPPYERARLQRWWDAYYHMQQVFWTDQPATALVVDAAGGLLLTAASNLHGGAAGGRVELPDGGELACTLVAVNRPLDLALLRAAGPLPFPQAGLAGRPPRLGEAVTVAGRHERAATRTAGRVSVTDRRVGQHAATLIQTDARCNYGSLGGPLLAADGSVLGLVVMLGPRPDWPWLVNSGVAMAVDAPTLATALAELAAGRDRAALPTVGLGVRTTATAAGITVEAVLPGTGAAAAGLRPGDLIEAVDGVAVPTPPALVRQLMRHRAGARVTLAVRRGRERLEPAVELKEFE